MRCTVSRQAYKLSEIEPLLFMLDILDAKP